MKPIKTAIIPVVGYGTRCLPFSKSVPKEMMTVVDRPVVDYVVQEAIAAGVEHIIFVTQSSKTCIENYFTQHIELENHLQKRGQVTLLSELQNLYPSHIRFSAVRQPSASGLGDALLYAQHLIQPDEFFIVLLPDVLVSSSEDLLTLKQRAEQTKNPQILVQRVASQEVSRYGIIDFEGDLCQGQWTNIQQLIEKPHPDEAPSDYAIVGRYILPYDIFFALKMTSQGHAQEIQLTDGIKKLLPQYRIEGYAMQSESFDCGCIVGYLEASLFYAQRHSKYKEAFKQVLAKRVIHDE